MLLGKQINTIRRHNVLFYNCEDHRSTRLEETRTEVAGAVCQTRVVSTKKIFIIDTNTQFQCLTLSKIIKNNIFWHVRKLNKQQTFCFIVFQGVSNGFVMFLLLTT